MRACSCEGCPSLDAGICFVSAALTQVRLRCLSEQSKSSTAGGTGRPIPETDATKETATWERTTPFAQVCDPLITPVLIKCEFSIQVNRLLQVRRSPTSPLLMGPELRDEKNNQSQSRPGSNRKPERKGAVITRGRPYTQTNAPGHDAVARVTKRHNSQYPEKSGIRSHVFTPPERSSSMRDQVQGSASLIQVSA